jgi:acetoin:2,6-dichlorophenolindophenol oxidoreductase subunit alpha
VARTTTASTAAPDVVGAEALLRGLERMHLIRAFEDEMQRQFLRGEIHGTVHLYTGQEAVSTGVCMALEEEDLVAATYRGHGAALAKGTSAEAVAAELMGRVTGSCGGRAGSMNVIDRSHGLLGCFGIIGGTMACATGAALATRGEGRVSVAFFGDGTSNHGYFHECLNFAAVMRLPVVFVCENNLYGEFTPMAQVTAGGDIAARAVTLGITAEKVDGNDLRAVLTAATVAVERARSGDGPVFLEALTYRHLGHSKSDPGTYRPPEEVEAWKARDPLGITRRQLLEELGLEESEVDAAGTRAEREVADGVAAALAAPYPDPITDAAREYAP